MAEPAPLKKDADFWRKEIDRSREHWKRYRDEAYDVIERYRDERENEIDRSAVHFNVLYSNTETLKPAIYANAPRPDVRRRFMDKDPVGKAGSEVLQRALAYTMDCQDIDGVLECVRDDFVLPGFAVARVEYRPYFNRDKAGKETGIAYEEVIPRYVGWDEFAMSRSRTWDKVWWVAFATYPTKDEAKAAFGDKAGKLAYTYKHDGAKGKKDEDSDDARACVWEVWNKRERKRFFVGEGFDGFLQVDEDPLKLEQFFPCPKPLWMLSTSGSMIPIPEFLMYRNLADELDDITERIHVLVSALRRRGVYNAAFKDTLAKIANSARDNHFEPIEDWSTFVQNGGLKTSMEEQDLSVLAQTVIQLYEYRDRCLNIIYQVTGIADIIRGASNANETATAQAIKGKYAGMRIGAKQKAFAKFTRDLLRIMGEIIAERFSPQMLSMQSGVQLPFAQQKQQWQAQQQAEAQQWQQQAQMAQQQQQPPPPQPQVDPEQAEFMALPTWEEVTKVLRNDKLRGFKIDIETDSTVLQDAEVERQQRIEFLQAVGATAQGMIPAIQSGLLTLEGGKELISFAARGFKVGSAIEEALDEKPQGPSPQMQQAQQQIQQQAQELQKRAAQVQQAEGQAKEKLHAAELATKDAERKQDAAKHEAAMLDMRKGHQEALRAVHEEHARNMEAMMNQAETVASEAIDKATAGQQQMPMESP